MSGELQLKEYLENSTESSKRIRTILTILVVVTVLILAGFLNSWKGYAWNSERIRFRQDYVNALNIRIEQLEKAKKQLGTSPNGFATELNNLPDVFKKMPARYGSEECGKTLNAGATKEENEKAINDQLRCFTGAKEVSTKFLEHSIRAYVENTYLIKVPFFGVAFDINDLGVIGGLSLIVILLMLRLNLRNFIVCLRIGFAAASSDPRLHQNFYDILAGRQLFAFPEVGDPNQRPYKGKTEALWSNSKAHVFYKQILDVVSESFSTVKKALWMILKILLWSTYEEAEEQTKKQADTDQGEDASKKNEWRSNRHPLLALVPLWICLVPAIVYGAVVINDFRSYETGLIVNQVRTRTSFSFSVVCLVVIFGLGCWCVSKCIEIDELWKIFRPQTIPNSAASKEVFSGTEELSSNQVTPVLSDLAQPSET